MHKVLAAIATAALLAGCSGGASKVASSVPSTSNAALNGKTISVSGSVQLPQSTSRGKQVIINPTPGGGNVSVSLTPSAGSLILPGVSAAPLAACVVVPAGSTAAVALPTLSPIVNATYTLSIVESTGGCNNGANAAASGGTTLASFTSGAVALGFLCAAVTTCVNATYAAIFNGGAPIFLTAVSTTTATAVTAALNLGAPNAIVQFAMDPGKPEGSPITLSLQDALNNALPASTLPAASFSAATSALCGGTNGSPTTGQAPFNGFTIAPGAAGAPGGCPTYAGSTQLTTPLILAVNQARVPAVGAGGGGAASGGTGVNQMQICQVVSTATTGTGAQAVGTVLGCATSITLNYVPPSNTQLVLVYSGSNWDVVRLTGSTLTLTANGATTAISTVAINPQPQVYTVGTAAAFPTLAVSTGIAVNTGAGTVATGLGTKYAVSTTSGSTGATVQSQVTSIPEGTGFGGAAALVTSPSTISLMLNGLAWGDAAYTNSTALAPQVLMTDDNEGLNGVGTPVVGACLANAATGNTGTNQSTPTATNNCTGLWGSGALTAAGQIVAGAPVSATTAGNGQWTAGPNTIGGVPPGPVGITCDQSLPAAAGQNFTNFTTGVTGSGVCWIAANNSIYAISVTGNAPPVVSSGYLIAGSGVKTSAGGSGCGDSPPGGAGTLARFNFSNATHISLANDSVPPGLAGTAAASGRVASTIFVADYGCNALRSITVSAPFTTTTIGGQAVSSPGGLAFDPISSRLYVESTQNNSQTGVNKIFEMVTTTTGSATPFAGSGAAGAVDGLGVNAYPLQFQIGNVVSSQSTGAVNPVYAGALGAGIGGQVVNGAGVGLLTNSTPPNSGVASMTLTGSAGISVGGFANPTGMVYDPFISNTVAPAGATTVATAVVNGATQGSFFILQPNAANTTNIVRGIY